MEHHTHRQAEIAAAILPSYFAAAIAGAAIFERFADPGSSFADRRFPRGAPALDQLGATACAAWVHAVSNDLLERPGNFGRASFQ
jgi:hypothetical protein